MVYNALLQRRSIRQFQERRVEPVVVDRLMRAALLSPSGRNIRPWSFIVIDDPALIEKLSEAKPHGAAFLKSAPLAVAIIADTTQTDVWVEDTAVAATVLLLMADELGLGACWCQIRKRPHADDLSADEYVRGLLDIPDGFAVASIIGMGYAETPAPPYDETKLAFDKLFHNKLGTTYKLAT